MTSFSDHQSAGQLAKEEFDFETVHNIDEYGAEFVPTMREALKTWNMTVQFWLATIVYKYVYSSRLKCTWQTTVIISLFMSILSFLLLLLLLMLLLLLIELKV